MDIVPHRPQLPEVLDQKRMVTSLKDMPVHASHTIEPIREGRRQAASAQSFCIAA